MDASSNVYVANPFGQSSAGRAVRRHADQSNPNERPGEPARETHKHGL